MAGGHAGLIPTLVAGKANVNLGNGAGETPLIRAVQRRDVAMARALLAAGAQVVQIFDSWAGTLPPAHYREFSGRYIAEICTALAPLVPVTIFAKGAWFAVEDWAGTACRTIGLDWNEDPRAVRAAIGDGKTLQGNLDARTLVAGGETLRAATAHILDAMRGRPFVFNLGHGITPDTPPENVAALVEQAKRG